jgi:sigma-B regulation protein RsbU (phosphoserine phosphatase)
VRTLPIIQPATATGFDMFKMLIDEDSGVFPNLTPEKKLLRFLLVENNPGDAHLVQMRLEHGLELPFSLTHVETVKQAIELLGLERFDLILLDLTLPDSSGLSTFHSVHEQAKDDAILILSGYEDSQLALEAVRGGAQDYILKGDLSGQALGREVRFAMERSHRLRAERELESAREQIRIARKLQKGLYPQSAPQLDGFDIGGSAWAAEHACGDYFDFVTLKNGATGIVVGDVSGHGVGPAMKMVETRAALHALTDYEENLNRLIAGLNRIFCGSENPAGRRLFLTLFLARLDTSRRILEYASAGQQGFRLSAAGNVQRLPATTFPIGLFDEDPTENIAVIPLEPGDIIVIPTDGFYEAGSSQYDLFGIERMLDIVRSHRDESAKDIISAMYKASRDHTHGNAQEDDMAAIVLKVL